MDELRSLKQEAPATKKLDYNQDEKTAWKNKIKTTGTQKSTFKFDGSNKQKVTHTILERNSKLSHNIDVTPASPTTSDHHVASEPQHIRENQTGERNDTENNDRRKHDYKWNRENKKSVITAKKKNPNKITYQQTQIIKMCTSWVIVLYSQTFGRMEIKKFIRKQS